MVNIIQILKSTSMKIRKRRKTLHRILHFFRIKSNYFLILFLLIYAWKHLKSFCDIKSCSEITSIFNMEKAHCERQKASHRSEKFWEESSLKGSARAYIYNHSFTLFTTRKLSRSTSLSYFTRAFELFAFFCISYLSCTKATVKSKCDYHRSREAEAWLLCIILAICQ